MHWEGDVLVDVLASTCPTGYAGQTLTGMQIVGEIRRDVLGVNSYVHAEVYDIFFHGGVHAQARCNNSDVARQWAEENYTFLKTEAELGQDQLTGPYYPP